jgi:hypothetical protein
VCLWLLDLRCAVYTLSNDLCATQRQGVICGPRKQGIVGEQKLSKGVDLPNMPFAKRLLSDNDLRLIICDGTSHAARLGTAKCRHDASDDCRTPSTFGRNTVHPQDAASGKPLSRRLICVAWEKDARYWIGEGSGGTASWNVTTPFNSSDVLVDRPDKINEEGCCLVVSRKNNAPPLVGLNR